MMVVPTKIPPVLFRSVGYGEAYFKLLVSAENRGINEFASMCEGTNVFKAAKDVVQSAGCTATQMRDQLRTKVRKLLLLEIS
jgi:hypothetical protein